MARKPRRRFGVVMTQGPVKFLLEDPKDQSEIKLGTLLESVY